MRHKAEGSTFPERERFKDLKFGMFIHWSLFSLPGGHSNWRTPKDAIRQFRAEDYDPRIWVRLALDSGAKYIVFTTKHHDGFCLFETELTDFNSTRSPARRDLLRPLAEACHEAGMPLFLYYSLPDLSHQSFKPGVEAEFRKYVDFMKGQIHELSTRYGELAGFWLDPGPWHGPGYDYRITEIHDEILRDNQPGAMLMGRDYFVSEKRIPEIPGKMHLLGDDGEGVPMQMPSPGPRSPAFEVCDTINNSWQYDETDRDFKSPRQLLRNLVTIVGAGGNYLLNQGPKASGEVQREQASALEGMGAWLAGKGEAIYGTRPVEGGQYGWGCVVSRGSDLYLHVLDPPEGPVVLEKHKLEPETAGLIDGTEIEIADRGGVISVVIPSSSVDPIDTIIRLGNVDV